MRLGLIGAGSIGRIVANAIAGGQLAEVELAGIVDLAENDSIKQLAAFLRCPLCCDVPALLNLKPDLVIEAASAGALRSFARTVLESGVDLMIVSVGALTDDAFFAELHALAKAGNRRIHVPSGAIGGLDIIKAAAAGNLQTCRLTTTKPPSAFAGIPHVEKQGVDLGALPGATVLFEGTAREGVRLFPQNVNVAASISLAGLGPDKTMVRIVADPAASLNVHEVFIEGDFGEATIRLANRPSPLNAKSSYLTGLSVIAALKCASEQFRLGT